jgi:hypothetical protein
MNTIAQTNQNWVLETVKQIGWDGFRAKHPEAWRQIQADRRLSQYYIDAWEAIENRRVGS